MDDADISDEDIDEANAGQETEEESEMETEDRKWK